jgi:nicotinamide-nucleotide amidase
MPSVEIVTIGTELLLGTKLDSNSVHIGAALAEIGLDLYAKHSVGDNEDRLASTLSSALERCDGIITTGGLGPTVDDLTKEAIARALGVQLELHEPSLAALISRLAHSNRPLTENNRRQAVLPAGCVVLENPNGTAPGFIAFRADGRFVAAMPGVPREMRAMLSDSLVPWLRDHFSLRGGIVSRTLHTAGIPESEVDRRIEDLFRLQENPKIAVLAHGGLVDITLMAKVSDRSMAAQLLDPLEKIVRERIGVGIFGSDTDTLEGVIVCELAKRGLTLGFAESCTGGLLTEAIVRTPGASEVLRGSIIAYANDIKEAQLGVPRELLEAHGAVSAECAIAMARGALDKLHVNIAISVTGIAGPAGGTAEKPVGTVYIGIASRDHEAVAHYRFFLGSRSDIRSRSVLAALIILQDEILTMKPTEG